MAYTKKWICEQIRALKKSPASWQNVERLAALEFLKKHTPSGEGLSREEAEHWVRDMHSGDGSYGKHWSMEQTTQAMHSHGLHHDANEWYAVLNAMWTDYHKVAAKHGIDKPDFYIDLADAWLDDDDAVEDKAEQYFWHIVMK